MQAQTMSGGHHASPQMLAALRMLRAVFGSPGNPFAGNRAVVEFFTQCHLHGTGGYPPVPCKWHSWCQVHVHDLSVMRLWPQRAEQSKDAALLHPRFSCWDFEARSLQDSVAFPKCERLQMQPIC